MEEIAYNILIANSAGNIMTLSIATYENITRAIVLGERKCERLYPGYRVVAAHVSDTVSPSTAKIDAYNSSYVYTLTLGAAAEAPRTLTMYCPKPTTLSAAATRACAEARAESYVHGRAYSVLAIAAGGAID